MENSMNGLPDDPGMQKWWAYRADIMETTRDNAPAAFPLKPLFYMP